MKIFFSESALPNPKCLPRTAHYCRISLAMANSEFSLKKEDLANLGSVLEIEVPDDIFRSTPELTTPENHERMAPFYNSITIRKFIQEMSDAEICGTLEASGIEHEPDSTPTFG